MVEIEKEKLVLAFQMWNIESLDSPESFGDIDTSLDCAERQAGKLLECLEKVS